jgi:hypothetical protein
LGAVIKKLRNILMTGAVGKLNREKNGKLNREKKMENRGKKNGKSKKKWQNKIRKKKNDHRCSMISAPVRLHNKRNRASYTEWQFSREPWPPV